MTKDFFISYTKPDFEWAKWILFQLEQERYTCVAQLRDFRPSQDFVDEMKKALESSRMMIAVMSPDYFQSKFAQAEMQAAFASDMLLPVRVRPCQIPKLYCCRIYIDLVSKNPRLAQKELIEGVRAALTSRPTATLRRFPERPTFPGELDEKTSLAVQEPTVDDAGKKKKGPVRILFLGAEAKTGLDIRGEFKDIKRAVAESKHSDAVRFQAVFDVNAEMLFSKLNKFSPDVFHFSGKQDAGRIIMSTAGGGVTTIPEEALSGMFRSIEGIQLVILDTCYSLESARRITYTVDCAIGVRSWLYDEEATMYYSAFYRAVSAGRSLKDACGQAAAYCQMKGVPKLRLPELVCRRGLDARSIRLVPSSR
jgi:hypothetical protein